MAIAARRRALVGRRRARRRHGELRPTTTARSSSPSACHERLRHPQPAGGRRGPRLRGLEPPVRDADRQGGGRLRHDPGARRVVGGVQRRQDVHVQASRGLEVVGRRAADGGGRRVHGQRAREEEWLNYTSDRREPHREGDRRAHGRDHERGARTRSCRRWTSTSSRSTSGRSTTPRRSTKYDGARRRRLRPLHAQGGQARPVLVDAGERQLLGRQAPKVDEVVFRLFNNADAMVAALKSGEIDAAHEVPAAGVQGLSSRPRGSSRSRASRAASPRSRSTAAPENHASTGSATATRTVGHRVPQGDRARHRQADADRQGVSSGSARPAPRSAPRRTRSGSRRSRRPSSSLRPREGKADPRCRRLQGHERERHPRDAGRQGHQPHVLHPLRLDDVRPERRVRLRLAEGGRDRHDDQGRERLRADRDHRQGRLRHVPVGLDAVRRPRPGAVLLHVRPALEGPRRPHELLQRRQLVRPVLRRRLQGAEHRARQGKAPRDRAPRC